MTRFTLHRRWTLVLALVMSLGCCLVAKFVSVSAAGQNNMSGGVVSDPTDPGLNPPPSGDPDLPSGPGAKYGSARSSKSGSCAIENHSVGDGVAPRTVWTRRLRILLQALRSYYVVRF